MARERNLGVTEASIGLSVLLCLLISLGYVLVQRLGGSSPDLEVEVLTDRPIQVLDGVTPDDIPPLHSMVIEDSSEDDYEVPQTAQRPQWLAPRDDAPVATDGSHDQLRLAHPLDGFQPDYNEPKPDGTSDPEFESGVPLYR